MTREEVCERWVAHKAEQRAWRKRPLRHVAIPEVKQYGCSPVPIGGLRIQRTPGRTAAKRKAQRIATAEMAR